MLPVSVADALPVAYLVLTAEQRISHFNDHARAMLRLEASDIGRSLDALAIISGAGELRRVIEQAHACKQVLMRAAVNHQGSQLPLDVIAMPLHERAHAPWGTALIVLDTLRALADKELSTANAELESANEALAQLNAQLQAANETLRERIAELEQRGGQ
jgi:hypothetical protein